MITARFNILRKRLTYTVITFSILPALIITVCLFMYAAQVLDREYRARAASEFATLAERWKERVDGDLESSARALLTLSHAADGDGHAYTSFAGTFEILRRDMFWLQGAAILDATGEPVAIAGAPGLQHPGISRTSAPAGENAWRPLVKDIETGADGLPGFRIIAPMQGDSQGRTISLFINAALFSTRLDRERMGRTGEVFLIDGAGVLQTRSVMHGAILDKVDAGLAQAAPQDGTVRHRDWQGARLWFSVLPVDLAPGWRLVVQRDEREILQDRDAQAIRFAMSGLLALAVLGGFAVMAAGKAGRLVSRMEEEHARLAEHDMMVKKLDSISQLGVGIAHEVNNPLAIIGEEVGWMQDVLKRESFKDHPDAGELRDSLRQIVTQTARSREITHKLLSFGGKTDGTIRDTDLATLVSDVALLRRREASGKGIEIREETAGKLPVILSEPALLRQMLINLINNCMDAMPEGGVITISTAAGRDGGVILCIRDTGFGIPQENMDRIFDPFFTTKPPGKGAGLGLSICHGIVQRIGGRIFAESVPGEGTAVTVELPLEARSKTP